MPFCFSKDTFDTVPISVAFAFEIETVILTSPVQRRIATDEKRGVVHVVFLAEFSEERTRNSLVSGRFELCIQ
jgi:hypothetical protein